MLLRYILSGIVFVCMFYVISLFGEGQEAGMVLTAFVGTFSAILIAIGGKQ